MGSAELMLEISGSESMCRTMHMSGAVNCLVGLLFYDNEHSRFINKSSSLEGQFANKRGFILSIS